MGLVWSALPIEHFSISVDVEMITLSGSLYTSRNKSDSGKRDGPSKGAGEEVQGSSL